MLRIITHKSAAAAQRYYTDGLKREDYYSEGQEIVGQWYGKGADRLGLSGDVKPDDFAALVENRDPGTGRRLTARTNADRRVGYDFNFHACKSLSVVHALTGDERIVTAFRLAVAETMRELESAASTRVRRGRSDSERVTGNLAWAEFIHFTARPVGGIPDPQLHVHAFTFNSTFDPVECRWKAASLSAIKQEAPYYQAAFQARLAASVADLGYGIRHTRSGWEVENVPRSIIDKFSRRAAEIDELAKEKGITDAKAKDALAAKSRRGKRHGTSREELVKEWKGRLTPVEKALLAKIARREGPERRKVSAGRAFDEAAEKLFEKDSVIPVHRLVGEALRFGVGSVTPEAAWRELDRRKMIVREINGEKLCTTSDILAEEVGLINFVRTGRGMFAPFRSGKRLSLDPALSAEQRAVVRHLLTSNDQVMAVRGGAGTGKTTLMREVVRQIEATGLKVYAFAPSADASRGTLREAGFENAETVAHLLTNKKLQAQLRKSVIWIDEAGQLGSRDMAAIMRLAGHDTRVILTGDTAQHRPVARGDSLHLIQKYSGLKVAHVSQIRRQEAADYREAVNALSQGDLKTGFQKLDEMGAILEVQNSPERYRLIAEDFRRLSRQDYMPLVVSPTHREGAAATAAIRDAQREVGRIRNEKPFSRLESLQWSAPDRRLAENYEPGMVVQFSQNARGIVRGSRFEVSRVDETGKIYAVDAKGNERLLPLAEATKFEVFRREEFSVGSGDRIRITRNGQSADGRRLNNGNVFTVEKLDRKGQIVLTTGAVLEKHHGHLSYGYCQTSYSSQGRSVRDVLVAQSSDSFLASNREQFYVSISRGQQSLRIYTDDRQTLQEAVGNTSLRRSGVEFAGFSKSEINLSMADDTNFRDRFKKFKGDTGWRNVLRGSKSEGATKSHVENVLEKKGLDKAPESAAKREDVKRAMKGADGKARFRGYGSTGEGTWKRHLARSPKLEASSEAALVGTPQPMAQKPKISSGSPMPVPPVKSSSKQTPGQRLSKGIAASKANLGAKFKAKSASAKAGVRKFGMKSVDSMKAAAAKVKQKAQSKKPAPKSPPPAPRPPVPKK